MTVHSSLPAFYASEVGGLAAALVGERLTRLWPSTAGLGVLGVGYPLPYLTAWARGAARCLAAVLEPNAPGDVPAIGRMSLRPCTCLAPSWGLPFPDLCFDRVLLVHGLEFSGEPARLLRDVWRVLKEGGRLIVVVPNRLGAWAYAEETPFGRGRPYSRGGLERLLAGHQFQVARQDAALYVPPLRGRARLGAARACEAAGRAALPHLGGVTLTEAVKEVLGVHPLLAGGPVRARLPRRVLVDAG